MKPKQKKGRPKGVETVQYGFRAIKSELDKALSLLNDKTKVGHKSLKYFNLIESGEYEIKKK